MSTVEQVLRLKHALRQARTGESADEPEITHTTNRGHKLEQGAAYVSARTLRVPVRAGGGGFGLGRGYGGGRGGDNDDDDDIDDDDGGDEGDGGAADDDAAAAGAIGSGIARDGGADADLAAAEEDLAIDVARILQPISDPAEVASHPAIKQNFMNPFLEQLAHDVLDELVDERAVLAQVARMLEALLGDDDAALVPQIMAKLEELPPYPAPEPGQPLPPVHDDVQWFFSAPQLELDADHGLGAEEAQELREKLQVVQQQMAEYVRCLDQIRSDLTHTHILRRTVFYWCLEMNNEDYVKADLDAQNNYDNAELGEQPAKDVYQNGAVAAAAGAAAP